MRFMGQAPLISVLQRSAQKNERPASPKNVPAGVYGRNNEDTLFANTGMGLEALFNKIVAQNSPRFPSSPSPRDASFIMQRARSLPGTGSPPRRPSMDESDTSHIFISGAIPEDFVSAVCELWVRRIQAASYWWLADDINFDAPNEEALFAVVRLALIERVRAAQLAPPGGKPACDPAQVVLFSGDDTNMCLQKAIVAARTLTRGDRDRVRVLDHVLQRRVASADYPVRAEEIPRGDELTDWQAATSAILRHLQEADGALRNSDLIDALRFAWEQQYDLQG